jgi:hypothetical protein
MFAEKYVVGEADRNGGPDQLYIADTAWFAGISVLRILALADSPARRRPISQQIQFTKQACLSNLVRLS